jgi:DnaJ-class molecular chaperone
MIFFLDYHHHTLFKKPKEKFKEVLEAYKVLSDESIRKQYDDDFKRMKNGARGATGGDPGGAWRGGFTNGSGPKSQQGGSQQQQGSRFTYDDYSDEVLKESGKYRQKTGYDGGYGKNFIPVYKKVSSILIKSGNLY